MLRNELVDTTFDTVNTVIDEVLIEEAVPFLLSNSLAWEQPSGDVFLGAKVNGDLVACVSFSESDETENLWTVSNWGGILSDNTLRALLDKFDSIFECSALSVNCDLCFNSPDVWLSVGFTIDKYSGTKLRLFDGLLRASVQAEYDSGARVDGKNMLRVWDAGWCRLVYRSVP